MSGIEVLRFAIPFWSAVFIAYYTRYHWWRNSSHHDHIGYSLITLLLTFFSLYALENYALAALCRQEAKERKQENEKTESELP